MINLPELKELQFCENTHTYTVNGFVVPSVSEIMKPLSAAHYGGIDTDTLNKAANRGTIVHAAVENYLLFGIEDISKELRGYFDGFKKWIDKVKPVPIKTECRIYHKTLNYAGTADLPCYIDDVPTLVDFKTTATVAKVLTRVQLEAYKKAFESHDIKFERKTVQMTKYPEAKEMRGVMKLTKKVPDKKYGFKLTYESGLKDRNERQTLEEWLLKEERWQTERQKTKAQK